jgi:hypothetical protein
MFEPVARRGREYRRIIDVKQGVEYYRKYEKDNLLGDDWWIAPDLGASRDKDNTIVSGESKKLTLTDKRFSAWALSNRMKKGMAIEPGATYSLSWFMKVDLETIQCGGGAAMSLGLLSPDKKWVKSWKVPAKSIGSDRRRRLLSQKTFRSARDFQLCRLSGIASAKRGLTVCSFAKSTTATIKDRFCAYARILRFFGIIID